MNKIQLTKETINEIFDLHNHQAQVCLHLYRIAFPKWDAIKSLNGYPTVSETTNKYIMGKFIELDQKNHPDVLAGGLWMNKGFSTYNPDKQVNDWEIDLSRVQIEYLDYEEIVK